MNLTAGGRFPVKWRPRSPAAGYADRLGRSNPKAPMSNASATLTIVLCVGSMVALPGQAAERWFLLSRHGECAKVESLKRKIPDLGEVNDPHAFAALMQKNRQKVTLREIPVSAGKAYEVTVPDKELFLIFATSEMCGNPGMR